ncbi:MAG: hypothetical protein EOO38_01980 [Cytophagaceae bacterium]|nr:MAG: hypothetical protein EOO38_01980 [Cytophagaceae bacterium]
MTYKPATPDIIEGIVSGKFVCLKDAAKSLGLSYPTGRRRILRDRLPIWELRWRKYVRVSDLSNPSLLVP